MYNNKCLILSHICGSYHIFQLCLSLKYIYKLKRVLHETRIMQIKFFKFIFGFQLLDLNIPMFVFVILLDIYQML